MTTIEKLYKRDSFYRGMASFIDLFGVLAEERNSHIYFDDNEALANDWHVIGKDLTYSMEMYKKMLTNDKK